MIVFRFKPTSVVTYRQVVRCILNNSASNALPIAVIGTGSAAGISFPELGDASDDATHANGNGHDDYGFQNSISISSLARLSSRGSVYNPSSPANFSKNSTPFPSESPSKPPGTGGDYPNKCFYFRITCVGTITRRSCIIHNPARIPIVFQVRIPEKYQNVLQIEPSEGELLGNETIPLTCTFTPIKAKKYAIRIQFSVCAKTEPFGAPAEPYTTASLLVVGEAILGRLELDASKIDFGNVLIGAATQREITIRNTTPCDVQYSLEWRLPNGQQPDTGGLGGGFSEIWDVSDSDRDQNTIEEQSDDEYGAPDEANLNDTRTTSGKKRHPVLEIVPAMGSIPAYSSTTTSVIIRPRGLSILAYKMIS